jgi:hypothetical protein
MSDSPAEPIVQVWCHQCHALLVRDQAQAGIVACERADCPWPGAAKRFAAASRRIRPRIRAWLKRSLRRGNSKRG